MRKVMALCCLLGILLLSACAPTGQTTGTTTTTTTTTTTSTTADTTTVTDDSAWSDTDWSDDFTEPTDSVEPDEEEEDVDHLFADLSDLYEEVLPTGNPAEVLDPQKGGADAEAEALRQEINNSKDELKITGTIYYVSPKGDDFSNDG